MREGKDFLECAVPCNVLVKREKMAELRSTCLHYNQSSELTLALTYGDNLEY